MAEVINSVKTKHHTSDQNFQHICHTDDIHNCYFCHHPRMINNNSMLLVCGVSLSLMSYAKSTILGVN